MADVGQASAHGGSSHWLHRVTWNARRAAGNVPTSTALTYVRFTPSGTAFSDLHAVLQAWQPMQRVWSMTFPQRTGSVPARTSADRAGSSRVLVMHLLSVRASYPPLRENQGRHALVQ